jgi:hypothetical protein
MSALTVANHGTEMNLRRERECRFIEFAKGKSAALGWNGP